MTAEVVDVATATVETDATALTAVVEESTAIFSAVNDSQPTTDASTTISSATAEPSPTRADPVTVVSPSTPVQLQLQEYAVPPGSHPHDVAPAPDGTVWYTAQHLGELGRLDPATGAWREWLLPGERPMPYAVYVDENDMIWLSDFGANALVRFDPAQEAFEPFPIPSPGANVRQILGRAGEIWGAESGSDRLIVVRDY
jgi:streptogramin lyase